MLASYTGGLTIAVEGLLTYVFTIEAAPERTSGPQRVMVCQRRRDRTVLLIFLNCVQKDNFSRCSVRRKNCHSCTPAITARIKSMMVLNPVDHQSRAHGRPISSNRHTSLNKANSSLDIRRLADNRSITGQGSPHILEVCNAICLERVSHTMLNLKYLQGYKPRGMDSAHTVR